MPLRYPKHERQWNWNKEFIPSFNIILLGTSHILGTKLRTGNTVINKGIYDLVKDNKFINRWLVTKCVKCYEGKQRGIIKADDRELALSLTGPGRARMHPLAEAQGWAGVVRVETGSNPAAGGSENGSLASSLRAPQWMLELPFQEWEHCGQRLLFTFIHVPPAVNGALSFIRSLSYSHSIYMGFLTPTAPCLQTEVSLFRIKSTWAAYFRSRHFSKGETRDILESLSLFHEQQATLSSGSTLVKYISKMSFALFQFPSPLP